MKPSLSLILFTVLSGAGLGLFILTVTASTLPLEPPMSTVQTITGAVLALILTIAGLISSVFHLHNPKNAIKAFNRIRSSWLSREGVFSLLFLILAFAYIIAIAFTQNPDGAAGMWLGWLAIVAAVATLFSTAMIYASLKTIRQWHNPLVPPAYLLIGPASGGVILCVLRAFSGGHCETLVPITASLLGLAAGIKLIYYFWIGQPAGPTPNTATGFTRERMRLLDVGHSFGTFLTDEFGHRISRGSSGMLRTLALILAFIVPATALILASASQSAWWTVPALLSVFAGLILERWLFLIEGQHVVNLYHGRQRT